MNMLPCYLPQGGWSCLRLLNPFNILRLPSWCCLCSPQKISTTLGISTLLHRVDATGPHVLYLSGHTSNQSHTSGPTVVGGDRCLLHCTELGNSQSGSPQKNPNWELVQLGVGYNPLQQSHVALHCKCKPSLWRVGQQTSASALGLGTYRHTSTKDLRMAKLF